MSLFYLTLICVVVFLMSVLALILQHKHLLSILLSLEAKTVNLFVMLFVLLNKMLWLVSVLLFLLLYVSSFSFQKC